jgi:exodeoxyribonuclease X
MAEIIIRVVDLETSGKARADGHEVVELASTDLYVDSDSRAFRVADTVSELYGVSKPMDPEVIAVHHIRNETVAGLPICTPEDIRRHVTTGEPQFIAAHQADFERQWITDDLIGRAKWLDTYKAARQMRREGPYSNQALKYAMGLGHLPHDRCMPPHAAGPDSFVTAHILGLQLMEVSGAQIEAWTRSPVKYWTCPIGEKQGWAGKPWSVIEHGFLTWMLSQANMEPDLKIAARAELAERRDRQTAHLNPPQGSPS